MFSYFYIELEWFDQFELTHILVIRWIIQFSGLIMGLIIISLSATLLKKWKSVTEHTVNVQLPRQLYGFNYGITLLISITVITITINIIALLSTISIIDPFSLSHWWSHILDQILNHNTIVLTEF